MVGVIAAVGGEVEGDREPLLAAGEVGAVEGVGFLGGGEAGILAQRPGPAGVHGRLGPTGEGREAGQASKRLEALEVLRRSEEHTSELQSLMRISYAVFCLTQKTNKK